MLKEVRTLIFSKHAKLIVNFTIMIENILALILHQNKSDGFIVTSLIHWYKHKNYNKQDII